MVIRKKICVGFFLLMFPPHFFVAGSGFACFLEPKPDPRVSNYVHLNRSELKTPKEFFCHEHIEDICGTHIKFLAYVFITCTRRLHGVHTMSFHDFLHFLTPLSSFKNEVPNFLRSFLIL